MITVNWSRLVITALVLSSEISESSANGQGYQCEDFTPALSLGPVDNPNSSAQVLATMTIQRPALDKSLRLYFAGGEVLPKGTYVRVTSLDDYRAQNIDSREISDWRYTSAWFNIANMHALYVELVCGPFTTGNTIRIARVCSGNDHGLNPICEECPTVEPAMSDRGWSARIFRQPGICSAAMWSTHGCLITAYHCAHTVGDVAEFAVPPSTATGQWVHPDPADQFVITGRVDSNGTGDWAVLTLGKSGGRTAFQRQIDPTLNRTDPLRRIGSAVVPQVCGSVKTAGYGRGSGAADGAQKESTGIVRKRIGVYGVVHDGWVQPGNSGGGVVFRSTDPVSVEVLIAVCSVICHPYELECPEEPLGPSCYSQPWPVMDPLFVAARQSLCGDCIRDCNGDGLITLLDRDTLRGWITSNNPMGDLNGDGFVNNNDLILFDQVPLGSACVQAEG